MDGYQLFTALFSSLISLKWPVVVSWCVWLFRKPLTELLPFLRMRYKEFDVSFGLDKAEQDAQKLPPPISAPKQISSRVLPAPKEIVGPTPRMRILKMNETMKEALNEFIEIANAPERIERLRGKKELIDKPTVDLFNELLGISGRAAFSINEPSVEDAARFEALAGLVIGKIEAATEVARSA